MNKKNIFIYDFALNHTNRGCEALTIGSISFLRELIKLDDYQIITPLYCLRFKKDDEIFEIEIDNKITKVIKRYYWLPDIIVTVITLKILKIAFPFSKFYKDVRKLEYVANISGGDGFSDIYRIFTYFWLVWPSLVSVLLKKKLIILPQTIGPFKNKLIKSISHYIIKNAHLVFVRDLAYSHKLNLLSIKHQLRNDVSYYMKPKIFDFDIPKNAIGINVSGLAYYNKYHNLSGKFTHYKDLIIAIINLFHSYGVDIYLVPHTYDFKNPIENDDDLLAAKEIYSELEYKNDVYVINKDLDAAKIKYIISKFSFFIGTRMHSNFAAIFTNVPVFGLAYSYKFSGSFDSFGLKENYASIIDIGIIEIDSIVKKIDKVYKHTIDKNNEIL